MSIFKSTNRTRLFIDISNYIERLYINPTPAPKPAPKPAPANSCETDHADNSERTVAYSMADDYLLDTAISEIDLSTPDYIQMQNMFVRNSVDINHFRGYMSSTMVKNNFAQKMQSIMNSKHLLPVTVYNRAGLDRRLFSKICGREPYNPSKDTCISIILALDSDKKTAEELLSLAGYSLSRSNKRDLIINYFIENGPHSVETVNEMLDMFHYKILCA